MATNQVWPGIRHTQPCPTMADTQTAQNNQQTVVISQALMGSENQPQSLQMQFEVKGNHAKNLYEIRNYWHGEQDLELISIELQQH